MRNKRGLEDRIWAQSNEVLCLHLARKIRCRYMKCKKTAFEAVFRVGLCRTRY